MIIKKVSRSAVVAPLRLRSVRAAWSFYIPPAAPARRWQSVLASPPVGVVGVLLSGAAASSPRLSRLSRLPRAVSAVCGEGVICALRNSITPYAYARATQRAPVAPVAPVATLRAKVRSARAMGARRTRPQWREHSGHARCQG